MTKPNQTYERQEELEALIDDANEKLGDYDELLGMRRAWQRELNELRNANTQQFVQPTLRIFGDEQMGISVAFGEEGTIVCIDAGEESGQIEVSAADLIEIGSALVKHGIERGGLRDGY